MYPDSYSISDSYNVKYCWLKADYNGPLYIYAYKLLLNGEKDEISH